MYETFARDQIHHNYCDGSDTVRRRPDVFVLSVLQARTGDERQERIGRVLLINSVKSLGRVIIITIVYRLDGIQEPAVSRTLVVPRRVQSVIILNLKATFYNIALESTAGQSSLGSSWLLFIGHFEHTFEVPAHAPRTYSRIII